MRECVWLWSVKIPRHLNGSLFEFVLITSFDLNKSTNFRISRLGLNSFPLPFIRSPSFAKWNLRPFKFIHQTPSDFAARPRSGAGILYVKNVNTFPMQTVAFNLRGAQLFHPCQFFPHQISGDNKIKTYSSQHVNWFPACVHQWAWARARLLATRCWINECCQISARLVCRRDFVPHDYEVMGTALQEPSSLRVVAMIFMCSVLALV